jgi:hypothetical protein
MEKKKIKEFFKDQFFFVILIALLLFVSIYLVFSFTSDKLDAQSQDLETFQTEVRGDFADIEKSFSVVNRQIDKNKKKIKETGSGVDSLFFLVDSLEKLRQNDRRIYFAKISKIEEDFDNLLLEQELANDLMQKIYETYEEAEDLKRDTVSGSGQFLTDSVYRSVFPDERLNEGIIK